MSSLLRINSSKNIKVTRKTIIIGTRQSGQKVVLVSSLRDEMGIGVLVFGLDPLTHGLQRPLIGNVNLLWVKDKQIVEHVLSKRKKPLTEIPLG